MNQVQKKIITFLFLFYQAATGVPPTDWSQTYNSWEGLPKNQLFTFIPFVLVLWGQDEIDKLHEPTTPKQNRGHERNTSESRRHNEAQDPEIDPKKKRTPRPATTKNQQEPETSKNQEQRTSKIQKKPRTSKNPEPARTKNKEPARSWNRISLTQVISSEKVWSGNLQLRAAKNLDSWFEKMLKITIRERDKTAFWEPIMTCFLRRNSFHMLANHGIWEPAWCLVFSERHSGVVLYLIYFKLNWLNK